MPVYERYLPLSLYHLSIPFPPPYHSPTIDPLNDEMESKLAYRYVSIPRLSSLFGLARSLYHIPTDPFPIVRPCTMYLNLKINPATRFDPPPHHKHHYDSVWHYQSPRYNPPASVFTHLHTAAKTRTTPSSVSRQRSLSDRRSICIASSHIPGRLGAPYLSTPD
jgi:hypothetical protein